MRLNWFSALPPVASAAADSTCRLLPLLREQAEVVLWTSQTDWSKDLEALASVRRFHPGEIPWADLNQADATVYQLDADNAEVSRDHFGIVVLHGEDAQVERALAVLVHSRTLFERHKSESRWPVVYTPSPLEQPASSEECVAALLRLVTEATRYQAQLLARELTGRVAVELGNWTTPATGQTELRQVAQAIHDLTVGSALP
jgi:hypothetical protein